jgi:DNA repair exonuclease SbcCD ATPase subunit
MTILTDTNEVNIMKKIFVSTLIFCAVCQVYAQEDLISAVTRQAVEIDSLKKKLAITVTTNENYIIQVQRSLKNLEDSVKMLNTNLAELQKYNAEKEIIDAQLQAKSDSISKLKNKYDEEKQKGQETAREERQKGKDEVFESIVRSYSNKPFDDLIKSSTKESVQRDLPLVGEDNPNVKNLLSDLAKYFNSKELLTKKCDKYRLKETQNQLKTINQRSESLERLREIINNYDIVSIELKKIINKIADLDKRISVTHEEIQEQKFNKILTEISSYIFNYDFNLSDYPFLSDILLEIIKRKYPDADANISDLLQQL